MSSAASAEDTSTVLRESVVALAPRRAQTAPPEPTPLPPVAAPARADHAFVGVLATLTALLAARLLLLLSILGAFVLAVMALREGSYLGLAVLVSYCALTVLPMTYLDVVTHKRKAV